MTLFERRLHRAISLLHAAGMAASILVLSAAANAQTAAQTSAPGPLRVHSQNPRYFADPSGKPVYLTGSHTWNNVIDMGRSDPPEAFDYKAYLDFLERHGHNFVRLWAWDSTKWDTRANRGLGKDFVHTCAPQPWARTGPGMASDGKPKFDLHKFNDAYFERLRDRVQAAGRRGIYVSVMLFEGWGLYHGNRRATEGWAWHNHPFHPDNNTSGINGDPDGDGKNLEVHTTAQPAINALQKAYIHKVIDTVNDLDNVLYEVINEGGQKEWDWWVVETVKAYERTKPKQHSVGLTGHGAERVDSMLASPADWTSPGRNDGYGEDAPAWNHPRVSLHDTDHIWGTGGNPRWVWKAFVRGHNPIFMDPYDNSVLAKGPAESWEPLRHAMGHTRQLAQRVDLTAMKPHDDLASTKYCLAQPGVAYIVYLDAGRDVTVNLSGADGKFNVEWIHPVDGTITKSDPAEGGKSKMLQSPIAGPVVLYLYKPR
jgi:hypothetical protein